MQLKLLHNQFGTWTSHDSWDEYEGFSRINNRHYITQKLLQNVQIIFLKITFRPFDN